MKMLLVHHDQVHQVLEFLEWGMVMLAHATVIMMKMGMWAHRVRGLQVGILHLLPAVVDLCIDKSLLRLQLALLES